MGSSPCRQPWPNGLTMQGVLRRTEGDPTGEDPWIHSAFRLTKSINQTFSYARLDHKCLRSKPGLGSGYDVLIRGIGTRQNFAKSSTPGGPNQDHIWPSNLVDSHVSDDGKIYWNSMGPGNLDGLTVTAQPHRRRQECCGDRQADPQTGAAQEIGRGDMSHRISGEHIR